MTPLTSNILINAHCLKSCRNAQWLMTEILAKTREISSTVKVNVGVGWKTKRKGSEAHGGCKSNFRSLPHKSYLTCSWALYPVLSSHCQGFSSYTWREKSVVIHRFNLRWASVKTLQLDQWNLAAFREFNSWISCCCRPVKGGMRWRTTD